MADGALLGTSPAAQPFLPRRACHHPRQNHQLPDGPAGPERGGVPDHSEHSAVREVPEQPAHHRDAALLTAGRRLGAGGTGGGKPGTLEAAWGCRHHAQSLLGLDVGIFRLCVVRTAPGKVPSPYSPLPLYPPVPPS